MLPAFCLELPDVDRDLVERRIVAIWDCRTRGDIDGMMRHFTPDCVYVACIWVGQPVTIRRVGGAACATVAHDVNITFENLGSQLTDLVIDGDRAAACRKTRVRHRGTRRIAELDVCYLVRFRDGLVAEMHEHVDTLAMTALCGG